MEEERIRNTEVRERFFNIPTIQNQIEKRQLTFIGKVVRNSDQQLPTKLLTAWCNHKRRRGRVLHSNKKSIVQNIALILPCIGKTERMSEWVHYALENGYWKYLIANLGNSPKPQPAQATHSFIGKVVRNSDKQLPTKLLTAWWNHKRRRSRVFHSNKKSIVQNIALVLPCIGKTGRMSEWVHYALDNGYWKYLIANLGNSPKPQPAQEPSTSSSQNENGRYSPPNSPPEN